MTEALSNLSEEQHTNYHCCAEWHLARLRPICAVIYPFAYRIAKDSKKFSGSARGVAEFFGCNEKTIQRGFKELVEAGFFLLQQEGHFEPNIYRVLSHQEWIERNPNQCAIKIEYAWTGEGDPLGQRLYAASGCRIKFMGFQVQAYRDTGLPEDEIVSLFERFLAEKEAAYRYPKNRKSAGYEFLMFLRDAANWGSSTREMLVRSAAVPRRSTVEDTGCPSMVGRVGP